MGDRESDTQVAGQVLMVVDTGTDRISVGGWNAVVEDVEATRIVITDVTDADDYPSRRAGTEPAE